MAIKGSLKEASLPDVLQLLAMADKTGCLSVTDQSSFGYIYFDEGRIIYASLLNRRDRLGDILVREGAVTRDQLEEAIKEQSKTRDGRRLGEILKDQASIDDDTLRRYVQHQIEEAVYLLFTWNQGTFYFEAGQHPEKEPIQVSIDPESLLLEGARRIDEWSQIEKKIPSFELIFTIDSERSSSIASLNLTAEQEKLLPYLDGNHSGWDLIEETALPEFDVGKALYGLLSAGLVRRAGKRDRSSRAGNLARVDEHRNLGIAFYKTSMYEDAIRELRQVLQLDSGALDAEFYLGLVALRQGEPEEAERQFRLVIKRGGKTAAVFNNLAQVLWSLGKAEEALEVLDQGLEKAGDRPRLFLSKAVIQLRLGDHSAAKSSLDRYKDRVSADGLPALYYSAAALAEGMSSDLEAAARLAEEGVARHPTSAALTNNAGVIFERNGDIDRALELYQLAFEQDSGLPQASKNLGDIQYRDGNYEEAAAAYERALVVDPGLGDDVYAKLGNVYYKKRERERAIEMWTRALELNPGNEVVQTNLELVEGAAGET